MSSDSDLFCPACTYNLRGITSERCPECGAAFNRTKLAVSHIPWVHRREIGRIRAYWRTLWLATFHPKRIAQDMSAPVNYQDGRRFAYVTLTLTVLSVVVPMLFLPLEAVGRSQWDTASGVPAKFDDVVNGSFTALQDHRWGIALDLLAFGMALLLSMRLAQFFFRPRRLSVVQQNRAAALSQYGSGAILWVGLIFGSLISMSLIYDRYHNSLSEPPQFVFTIAFLILGLSALWWFAGLCLLLYRTTHCGFGRVAAFIIGFPICLWVGMFLACAMICICGFLGIVIASSLG